MTRTLTMTHSDEVTNESQIPGPTYVSAGVMTPHKESVESARIAQQARKKHRDTGRDSKNRKRML